jgi:hypothetical protein
MAVYIMQDVMWVVTFILAKVKEPLFLRKWCEPDA